MTLSPLIVTVKMDADTQDFFTGLRRQHFPPEKNHLAAHVTLFHHLPGEHLDEIEDQLKITASRQYEFKLQFPRFRSLGHGTAAEIESVELVSLRNKLCNAWSDYLSPQDRQKFEPHVTIQNKVDAEAARRLLAEISAEWQPRTGTAVALQLWHYRGGPWQLANEFDFYKTGE